MIVADTNLLVYLHLPGEHTTAAEQALLRDPEWIAPPLWRSEFLNVLTLYIRQGRLVPDEALTAFERAEVTLQGREVSAEPRRVLELSRTSTCSAYDCEFVALAEMLGIPLITSDKRILSNFPAIAAAPGAFAGSENN